MIWSSFSDFLSMGGYAPYVWGSYGVTLLVITAEVFAVRRRRRVAHATLIDAAHARP